MKVVLTQTVPKVGKQGQVVNVAPGFARNFLFNKGLATVADKAMLATLARADAKRATEVEKTKGSAETMAESLAGKTVTLVGKTAKGSAKLFGAITSQDIADAIKAQLGVDLDKRNVPLLHPIKRIGIHDITLDLHRHVDAHIKLAITDEEGNLGVLVETRGRTVVEETPPEETEAVAESNEEAEPVAVE